MNIVVTVEEIAALAPNARSGYLSAFAADQGVLDLFEISKSSLRVAHFIAQVMHESGGLTVYFECLNYSAERLPKVWPKRFQPTGPLDPVEFAHNPEKLANEVYGGRMGNTRNADGY